MRYSLLLGKTVRGSKVSEEVPSLSLLIKGGFIRPLDKGLYSFLPMGIRVLERIKAVIRQEIEAIGGQEVLIPLVSPIGLWENGGRIQWIGEELAQFKGRDGQKMLISPSHEEQMVDLVRRVPHGNSELPLLIYQFQTKYRDEKKTWGGLIRSKEFIMKDAYSFHRSFTCLNNFFPKMYKLYQRIFTRLDLEVLPSDAGVGYMGGEKAFEFLMPFSGGDVEAVVCPACGYTANRQVAVSIPDYRVDPLEPMLEKAISGEYNNFTQAHEELGVPQDCMVKPLIFDGQTGIYLVLVRGDQWVSLEKIRSTLGDPSIAISSPGTIYQLGLRPGFASPIGLPPGVKIIVDENVAYSTNLVIPGKGGQSALVGANFGRDWDGDQVAQLAMVKNGEGCKYCKNELEVIPSIELGHIFKLGDRYTKKLALRYQKETGESYFPHMGSYGIGLGRLMSAIAQKSLKNNGIHWPLQLAPFMGYIMAIGNSNRVRDKVEEIYHAIGPEKMLYDDRKLSAGKKFQDVDLLGIPLRLVLTRKLLEEGLIEAKCRDKADVELWPLDQVTQKIKEFCQL